MKEPNKIIAKKNKNRMNKVAESLSKKEQKTAEEILDKIAEKSGVHTWTQLIETFKTTEPGVRVIKKKAIEAMEEYANTDKWMSSDERLPEDETKKYLVIRDGETQICTWIYRDGQGYWYNYLGLTHWQPLPNKPKAI